MTDLRVRYRNAARYDDPIRIRCRVEDVGSRRVVFSYRVEHAESGMLIADAETTLVSLDSDHKLTRMPVAIVEALRGEGAPDA